MLKWFSCSCCSASDSFQLSRCCCRFCCELLTMKLNTSSSCSSSTCSPPSGAVLFYSLLLCSSPFFFLLYFAFPPAVFSPACCSPGSDPGSPKKCRARFGLNQQTDWCGPCRWVPEHPLTLCTTSLHPSVRPSISSCLRGSLGHAGISQRQKVPIVCLRGMFALHVVSHCLSVLCRVPAACRWLLFKRAKRDLQQSVLLPLRVLERTKYVVSIPLQDFELK